MYVLYNLYIIYIYILFFFDVCKMPNLNACVADRETHVAIKSYLTFD